MTNSERLERALSLDTAGYVVLTALAVWLCILLLCQSAHATQQFIILERDNMAYAQSLDAWYVETSLHMVSHHGLTEEQVDHMIKDDVLLSGYVTDGGIYRWVWTFIPNEVDDG